MRAAETAGVADWYREHVVEQLTGIDREFVIRLVHGNLQHSQRRVHEMAAASTLLRQFGEPPLTSEATRQCWSRWPSGACPTWRPAAPRTDRPDLTTARYADDC